MSPEVTDTPDVVVDGVELAVLETTALELPELADVPEHDLYEQLLKDASKAKTRTARASDVRDFSRYLEWELEQRARPSVVTPPIACNVLVSVEQKGAKRILAGYHQHMLERKLTPATLNRRSSTLKRVLTLAAELAMINWSVDPKRLPVQTYRDTAGPGRAGWLRMYDRAKRDAGRSDQGKRDLAIVCLLYFCALRREEVVSLDVADWNPETGRLAITGKGRYEKELVTPNGEATGALESWLDVRGRDPGPLFTRLDNAATVQLARITGTSVWNIVRRLGKTAGLKAPARPHGLRHQAATEMARRSNGNVLKMQKALRHRDPKTTQIYVDNLEDTAGEMSRLLSED